MGLHDSILDLTPVRCQAFFDKFLSNRGKMDSMAKKRVPPEIAEFFRRDDIAAYFKREGQKGGKASAAALSPEQRSARARKAVEAREAKRKSGGKVRTVRMTKPGR